MVGANNSHGTDQLMQGFFIAVMIGCAIIFTFILHGIGGEEFMHRTKLEKMLIADEVGGLTVEQMLTVRHDGIGKYVVGIGHDVLPDDVLDLNDTITLRRAADLFDHDVNMAIQHAVEVVDDFNTQPEGVQIILCALAFQLGKHGLAEFHHMLAAIARRDYEAAAKHLLDSKLARSQAHARATREANRLREAK